DSAGIRVGKVQVTTGLAVPVVDDDAVAAIEAFADDVYLHQVVARTDGELQRYLDLPDAIAAYRRGARDRAWRVHFHVPVFLRQLGRFENTQDWLSEALRVLVGRGQKVALELETYTWDVLPAVHRDVPVVDAIVR